MSVYKVSQWSEIQLEIIDFFHCKVAKHLKLLFINESKHKSVTLFIHLGLNGWNASLYQRREADQRGFDFRAVILWKLFSNVILLQLEPQCIKDALKRLI